MQNECNIPDEFYLLVMRDHRKSHDDTMICMTGSKICMTGSKSRVATTLENHPVEHRKVFKINPEFLTEIKDVTLS